MGTPCEINSILKLSDQQGYPVKLDLDSEYVVTKSGYRIIPIDVPIQLVNNQWIATADIIITSLMWRNSETEIVFKICRIYELD